ncbi:PANK4-like protein [Mya arenaria]|uniref:4'-phosphopantetheine phosphatase n=1 Tax=Mya arenaria TaxID=6604 RepID=A0ABY7FZ44_MYAAR|nr:PANK4-like protein [Mya arenaria]
MRWIPCQASLHSHCAEKDFHGQRRLRDETIVRLHFIKFETKFIETCLDFIQAHFKGSSQSDRSVKNIPDEVFIYQRHGSPEYRFQGVTHNIFPYLLVNIGSGVSLIKTFDELLQLAERGDHRNVDMLVKDIYGGAYPLIGLPADLIASSFGKAARSPRQGQATEENVFKEEDVARSLLLSISNDIGQIAYLHAQLHGLKKIYFGGYFIRGHPLTMHTITYAINYWSKGGIQPLFLRHEGYLGAIGAFLKGAEEDESYSWEENFAGSSGLAQSSHQLQPFNSKFDKLELDRLEKVLLPCPLLASPDTYLPDTVDLTQDIAAQEYWLQCFTDSIDKQKQFENEHALKYLTGRLQDLDGIEDAQTRILELARGFLAGNVFDWGAKEVADIMEKGEFQFKDAESRLQDRPWLMDDFDAWVGRLSKGPVYRCVAVFCDNSGADIILGVFPFVRDLLMSGSKVILCANTKPTLNDVIYQELLILVRRVASMCPVIASALDTGMGRAIHTNFDARFSCDVLKVAVLKNRWLAQRLGGDMFNVVFKFEQASKSLGKNRICDR